MCSIRFNVGICTMLTMDNYLPFGDLVAGLDKFITFCKNRVLVTPLDMVRAFMHGLR